MVDENIKTLAVKLALTDSNFQEGMKNLRSQMREVDSDFKKSVVGMKNWGSSLDGLKANATALSEKIKIQKQVVEEYQKQLDKSKTALTENAEKMNTLKSKIDTTKKAYDESCQELGKNSDKSKELKKSLDDLEKEYSQTEKTVARNDTTIHNYTAQVNNATTELKKMQQQLAETSGYAVAGKKLEEIGKKVESTAEKISGVGESLTTGVTLPIIAAGTACSKFFINYENGMAKISTIADTSKISIDEIGESLKSLSNETGEDISTLQEAEYEALSSGIDSAKSTEFLKSAVKAAVGGFTDANTAVDGLTTVLNAYDKSADDAKEITNEMMVAQNLGKTTFGDMASSIGMVADTTAACNMDTKDLFSSLAVETAHGIDTSEAISGLRAALSNVIKPSQEAQKEAEKLGINFSTAHLKSVGWGKFLQEIAEKTGGDTEKMGLLFGSVQGLNTMVTLTSNSGMKLFNQSLNDMNSGVDYVSDAFDKVNNTSGKSFEKSINKLKNDAISLGKTLTPVIDGITAGIDDVHDVLDSLTDEQRELIAKIAEVVVAVGPALLATGKLTGGIGKLITGVGGVTKTFGSFVTGLKGVEDVAATAVPTAAKLGSAIGSVGGAATLGIGAFVVGAAALQNWANNEVIAETGAQELMQTIDKECESWNNLKKSTDDQAASDLTEIEHTQNLWKWLQDNVDATGKLTGSKELAAKAVDEINKTTGKEELKIVNGVVQGYKDQKKAIDDAIASKKAQVLLEAKEPLYKEALTNYTKKQNEQAELSLKLADEQEKADEAEEAYQKRLKEVGGKVTNDQQLTDLAAQSRSLHSTLQTMQSEYDKNEKSLSDYYSTIEDYEDASVAESEKNYKKTEEILGNVPLEYTVAGNATKAELEDQVKVTAAEAEQMRERYKAGVKGVTEEMVKDAETRAANAKTEYEKYGIESGKGVASGVNKSIPSIQNAGKAAGKAAANAIKSGLSTSTAFAAGKAFAGSMLDGYLYTINHSNIPTNSIFSDSGNMKFRSIGKNAIGTNNWRGGLTWVNEKGPELVNLPNGTQIVPHEATMEMARAAGDAMSRISALMSSPNVIFQSGNSSSSKLDINLNVKTDGNISEETARQISEIVSNQIALKIARR